MPDSLEEKKQNLREELERLTYEFKVEIPRRIAEARAYGDLKENAEYHAARERQSFVQARIAQLNAQLSRLKDTNLSSIPNDRIGFGSVVTVIDLEEEERIEFAMVSPNEVDPSAGKISLSSPIGAALNDRTAGETVEVVIPAGKKRYYIEKVKTIHGTVFDARRK